MIKYTKCNLGFVTFSIIAVVAVLVVFIGGGYFVYQRFVKTADTGRTVCSAEAKLCPDGFAVGRTGSNCEFAECPVEIDTSSWKTYRNEKYGFEFQYPSSWSIRTDGVNDLALLRPGMSFPDKKNLPAHDGTYWGDIVIDIHSNSENSTVAKYLEQSNMWNPFAENLQYKQFTVNSSEIFQFSHIPGFFTNSFAYVKGPKLIVEITDIDVDDEFGDKILNQILSTFRFTR